MQAQFSWPNRTEFGPGTFTIRDAAGTPGYESHVTVTNDADRVVRRCHGWGYVRGETRLFYYDSEGLLGELLHDGKGNFTGFGDPPLSTDNGVPMAATKKAATDKAANLNWDGTFADLVSRQIVPKWVHRVLFYGPPGTGKSRAPIELFGHCERITLHNAMPIEDLVGSTGLVGRDGSTSTVWNDGPAVRALRKGCPIVLDEVDKHSAELSCALHSLMDDIEMAGLTLPCGERVKPKAGFCVFATSNNPPDTLPEPILDRFDLIMTADVPAQGVLDALPGDMANMVSMQYKSGKHKKYIPAITVRSMLAVHKLTQGGCKKEEAVGLVFGPSKATDILASLAAGGQSRKAS